MQIRYRRYLTHERSSSSQRTSNFALDGFRPAACFDHENDDDDIPEGVLASKKQRDVRKLVRKLDIGQAA